MNLIQPNEVIEYAFLPRESIKHQSIKELKIDIVQQQYILPRFGDEMFDSMIEGEYAEFVYDYIKPALAFYVRASIIDELSILTGEDGAVVFDYNLLTSASSSSESQSADTTSTEEGENTEFSETENISAESSSERDYNSTDGQMSYVQQEVVNMPIDRVDNVIEGIEDQRVNETQATTTGSTKEVNSTIEKVQNETQSSSSSDKTDVNRLRAATSVERRILINRAMSDANILIAKAVRYVEKNEALFPDYKRQNLGARMFF